jgi:hypothetical protein
MVKGFLQIDGPHLAELLGVFGVDYEALRVYLWLIGLAPEGVMEGKERTLAARAGFASVTQLRFVLNRLALMRLHGQVLISFDNGPNGTAIIKVKELPLTVIRRGGGAGPKPEPAVIVRPEANEPKDEPLIDITAPVPLSPSLTSPTISSVPVPTSPTPSPVLSPALSKRKLSADAQAAADAATMEANLAERSEAAASQMRLWLANLAFGEPSGKLDPRTARTIWTIAHQIITGYDDRTDLGADGEQILIEAIQAAAAKTNLTSEGAARYLLSCARHGFSAAQTLSAGSRVGARVEPRSDQGDTDTSGADGRRVHTTPSYDDF